MYRLLLVAIACLGLGALFAPAADSEAGIFANMRARRMERREARQEGHGLIFGRFRANRAQSSSCGGRSGYEYYREYDNSSPRSQDCPGGICPTFSAIEAKQPQADYVSVQHNRDSVFKTLPVKRTAPVHQVALLAELPPPNPGF